MCICEQTSDGDTCRLAGLSCKGIGGDVFPSLTIILLEIMYKWSLLLSRRRAWVQLRGRLLGQVF